MLDYENAAWRERMRITYDFSNMMEANLGVNGIRVQEIDALAQKLENAHTAIEKKRDAMRWRALPFEQGDVVADIEQTAASVRERFENLVVLGIGGSALGPIAVQQALNHPHYNELSREKRGGPRLYVEDNIDPERMAALLDVIDVKTTLFNVISKSGGTSETMSQLLIVSRLLHDALGADISSHLIATTDASKGHLLAIARQEHLKCFVIPDGVGGRFSELCPVGLFAAAVCGVNIRALLAGAAYMDALCSKRDVWENPASMMAALSFIAMQKGVNISVLMPYADSLKFVSDWFAQLWAESLGKRINLAGEIVHAGQTPVKALGVTDQHSQVQLYTEGPFDRMVTFLRVEKYRATTAIPHGYENIPDVSFLGGHTHNELIAAEEAATEYALQQSGHLGQSITLPEVNAFTVGELLYLFEMATAYAGELLGIDAFNQPGVEAGKIAAFALLGKPGYDDKRAELTSRPPRNPKFCI